MSLNFFKKINIILAFTIIPFLGCAPLVKTNMDRYLENQELYKRKKIVFTAELEDLLERYELYKDKEVVVTAPISYFGRENFPTWYLTLEKDGKTIRVYEEHYRSYLDRDALNLIIWVKSEGGEVTIRGKLKENGIELKQLAYKDFVVYTNRLPYKYRYYGYHYKHYVRRRPLFYW